MTTRRILPLLLGWGGLLAGCGAPAPQADEAAANAASAAPPVAAAPAPPAAPGPVAQAIPAAFHGVYDRSAEACGRPSDYRLTVSARELRFHESIGIVRDVAAEGPGAVRVAADYQGEGERWRAVQRLSLAEGGGALTVTGPGATAVRVRCAAGAAEASHWQGAASGEGAGLVLGGPGAGRRLVLFCPSGSADLVVNVPAFRPVGSEERMSFGAGGTAVVLVADSRGDAQRGGVTGRGPVPAELAAILAAGEGIAVNYGSQNSGPHPAPPAGLARAFAAGCSG